MPRVKTQLAAVALVAALGVSGCDITPGQPVLDGDDGPSSLSPSDEAFAPEDKEPTASKGRAAAEVHRETEND